MLINIMKQFSISASLVALTLFSACSGNHNNITEATLTLNGFASETDTFEIGAPLVPVLNKDCPDCEVKFDGLTAPTMSVLNISVAPETELLKADTGSVSDPMAKQRFIDVPQVIVPDICPIKYPNSNEECVVQVWVENADGDKSNALPVTVRSGSKVEVCPDGLELGEDGLCPEIRPSCPEGMRKNRDGQCIPGLPSCPDGQTLNERNKCETHDIINNEEKTAIKGHAASYATSYCKNNVTKTQAELSGDNFCNKNFTEEKTECIQYWNSIFDANTTECGTTKSNSPFADYKKNITEVIDELSNSTVQLNDGDINGDNPNTINCQISSMVQNPNAENLADYLGAEKKAASYCANNLNFQFDACKVYYIQELKSEYINTCVNPQHKGNYAEGPVWSYKMNEADSSNLIIEVKKAGNTSEGNSRVTGKINYLNGKTLYVDGNCNFKGVVSFSIYENGDFRGSPVGSGQFQIMQKHSFDGDYKLNNTTIHFTLTRLKEDGGITTPHDSSGSNTAI